MHYAFGCQLAYTNIFKLSHLKGSPLQQVASLAQLRTLFLEFLVATQRGYVVNQTADRYFSDPESIASSQSAFGASTLNDLRQDLVLGAPISSEDRETFAKAIDAALLYIAEHDLHLARVFNLVVNKILLANTGKTTIGNGAHAGSSSGAIGLIWISGSSLLDNGSLVEVLVHELTHNLMFIDELVHTHYNYDLIADRRGFCTSAILDRLRPIDKVIHSIAVALEVVMCRRALAFGSCSSAVHPNSAAVVRSSLKSIGSVEDNEFVRSVASNRVFEILEAYRSIADKLLREEFDEIVLQ